jgi:hypothetical protein
VSLMALAAPSPLTPAYSISKRPYFRSLRALVDGKGRGVCAVPTGPTDTNMTRSLDTRSIRDPYAKVATPSAVEAQRKPASRALADQGSERVLQRIVRYRASSRS